MVFTNLIFHSTQRNQYESVYTDYIEAILGAYVNNGQILNYFEYPLVINNNTHYAIVIHEVESLNGKYDNPYVSKWKSELGQLNIKIEIKLFAQPDKSETNNNEFTDLILYAGMVSPIRRIKDFSPLPLYYLPYTDEEKKSYRNIKLWERTYLEIHSLWNRGLINEHYFLKQLSNYKSALSQEGIKICDLILKQTNKHCYYYLFRKDSGTIHDICPSCGSNWRIDGKLFDLFEYKCDKCLLIS
jgi:predicted  nucleic acid-binding Zn ribbon protein